MARRRPTPQQAPAVDSDDSDDDVDEGEDSIDDSPKPSPKLTAASSTGTGLRRIQSSHAALTTLTSAKSALSSHAPLSSMPPPHPHARGQHVAFSPQLSSSSRSGAPPPLGLTGSVAGMPGVQGVGTVGMGSAGLRRIQSSPVALSSLTKKGSGDGSGKKADAKTHQQKVARRLARKAEAARESRKKKKAYLQTLEDQVATLQARLAELEAAQETPRNGGPARHRDQQRALRSQMSHFLVERRSPMADTPHVDEQIDKLVQRHCVNSRQRQAGADEQFDRVRAILDPTVYTKFVVWGLTHKDPFDSVKPGLWQAVMGREAGLTAEQMTRLHSLRTDVSTTFNGIQRWLVRFARLQALLRDSLAAHSQHIEAIRIDDLGAAGYAQLCVMIDQIPQFSGRFKSSRTTVGPGPARITSAPSSVGSGRSPSPPAPMFVPSPLGSSPPMSVSSSSFAGSSPLTLNPTPAPPPSSAFPSLTLPHPTLAGFRGTSQFHWQPAL